MKTPIQFLCISLMLIGGIELKAQSLPEKIRASEELLGKEKVVAYLEIGQAFAEKGSKSQSLAYLRRARNLSEKIGNDSLEAEARIQVSESFMTLNRFDSAYYYLLSFPSPDSLEFPLWAKAQARFWQGCGLPNRGIQAIEEVIQENPNWESLAHPYLSSLCLENFSYGKALEHALKWKAKAELNQHLEEEIRASISALRAYEGLNQEEYFRNSLEDLSSRKDLPFEANLEIKILEARFLLDKEEYRLARKNLRPVYLELDERVSAKNTIEVKALFSESLALTGTPRMGLEIGLESLDLAEEIQDEEGKAQALKSVSLNYAALGYKRNAAQYLNLYARQLEFMDQKFKTQLQVGVRQVMRVDLEQIQAENSQTLEASNRNQPEDEANNKTVWWVILIGVLFIAVLAIFKNKIRSYLRIFTK